MRDPRAKEPREDRERAAIVAALRQMAVPSHQRGYVARQRRSARNALITWAVGDGLTVEDVAEATGLAPSTVRVILRGQWNMESLSDA